MRWIVIALVACKSSTKEPPAPAKPAPIAAEPGDAAPADAEFVGPCARFVPKLRALVHMDDVQLLGCCPGKFGKRGTFVWARGSDGASGYYTHKGVLTDDGAVVVPFTSELASSSEVEDGVPEFEAADLDGDGVDEIIEDWNSDRHSLLRYLIVERIAGGKFVEVAGPRYVEDGTDYGKPQRCLGTLAREGKLLVVTSTEANDPVCLMVGRHEYALKGAKLVEVGAIPEIAARIDEQLHTLEIDLDKRAELPDGLYLPGTVLDFADQADTGSAVPFAKLADRFTVDGIPDGHKVTALAVAPSADGKSAWASFLVTIHQSSHTRKTIDLRVSEVLAKTGHRWSIAGGLWSEAVDNADLDRRAAAGHPGTLPSVADRDSGDATVRAAFAALGIEGIPATARADLVAIGSGPGERTVGAKAFATPWNAAWVGHVTIAGPVRAELTPSGSTAWVQANIERAKPKSYKVPFRLFCVFDKGPNGWSLVHAHFAGSLR